MHPMFCYHCIYRHGKISKVSGNNELLLNFIARAAVPPSAQDEPTDFRDRAESRDPVARLTVYALNAAVMLFFFPLGMALLIFNILGGENLRTTAHALALTGLGTAIAATGQAGILLSLL